jgi:hypothetical protein
VEGAIADLQREVIVRADVLVTRVEGDVQAIRLNDEARVGVRFEPSHQRHISRARCLVACATSGFRSIGAGSALHMASAVAVMVGVVARKATESGVGAQAVRIMAKRRARIDIFSFPAKA